MISTALLTTGNLNDQVPSRSAANTTSTSIRRLTVVEKSGRYQDPVLIGEGGTAHIYQMLDKQLNRKVACKRFKKSGDRREVRDYLAELGTVSRLMHRNVVHTFDAGEDPDGAYLIMELIPGSDTEEQVKQHGVMTFSKFIHFADQCLDGLTAVHAAGLLHLDLKPSNIMISEQIERPDLIKLVDFGRAEPTQDIEGELPKGRGLDGSIYYAAPEQLLSEELDERADLYALGCVFYWALTGKRPFDGKDTLEVVGAHLQNQVDPLQLWRPEAPDALCNWLAPFLARDPEMRYQSAQDALCALLSLTS